MTPEQAIRSLRRQITAHGQDATFIHFASDGAKTEHPLRVFMRGYAPDELGGGIMQGDSEITIIGPDWIGLGLETLPELLSQVRISGRNRTVEVVDPFYLRDALVRINLQVRG